MENQEDLIVLLNDYGRFGWEVLPSQAGRPMTNTFPDHTNAESKGIIDFQTEYDWQTRHWQYISTPGDRREDFVNFRDKQVNLICAVKHNATQVRVCGVVRSQFNPLPPQPLCSRPPLGVRGRPLWPRT